MSRTLDSERSKLGSPIPVSLRTQCLRDGKYRLRQCRRRWYLGRSHVYAFQRLTGIASFSQHADDGQFEEDGFATSGRG